MARWQPTVARPLDQLSRKCTRFGSCWVHLRMITKRKGNVCTSTWTYQVSLTERQSAITWQAHPRPAKPQNCLSSFRWRVSEIHSPKQPTDASSTVFASQKWRRDSSHSAPKISRNIFYLVYGTWLDHILLAHVAGVSNTPSFPWPDPSISEWSLLSNRSRHLLSQPREICRWRKYTFRVRTGSLLKMEVIIGGWKLSTNPVILVPEPTCHVLCPMAEWWTKIRSVLLTLCP